MVYELRITLTDVGVPVWRVVQVDEDINFHDFHLLIQAAFDWTNSHLFGFHVDKSNGEKVEWVEITDQEIDRRFMPRRIQTYKTKEAVLSNWLVKPKDKITYTYDFGDNWEHKIELLKIVEADEKVEYPLCIRAKNEAPPEDSRLGIIEGEIDLVAHDNKKVRDAVNDMIQFGVNELNVMEEFQFDEPSNESSAFVSQEVKASPVWEKTLEITKAFLQREPWETLTENDLFVLVEPNTNQYLFCKVCSYAAGKENTLEIYVGLDGLFTYLALESGENLVLDGLQKAHVLFVSFEDYEDLSTEDYQLIQAHSTTFQGQKAWPIYASFEPGYYPWMMDEDDALLTQFAMDQILHIVDDVKDGLVIPSPIESQMILIRELDKDATEENVFKNRFSDLDALLREEAEETLVLSELEIKRFSKLKEILTSSIEFTITPIKIPVQMEEGTRPFYAPTVVALDVETGEIYYQEIFDEPQNIDMVQRIFLNTMTKLGGIPNVIYTDSATGRAILPFLDIQNFNLEIVDKLEGIDELLDDLTQFIQNEEG